MDPCIPCERRFVGSRPPSPTALPPEGEAERWRRGGVRCFLTDADAAASVAELF